MKKIAAVIVAGGSGKRMGTAIKKQFIKLRDKEVLAYTESFEFIVGMRLHSLIMAAACGVPMIGISYDPKVTAFCKEMKVPYCLNSHELTSEMFEKALNDLQSNKDNQISELKTELVNKKERIYLPAYCIKELVGNK